MSQKKKEYGGMGVPDLQNLNLCLLASLIKRYHLNKSNVWRRIVDSKYNLDNPNIFCCPDRGVSSFWKGVLWACKAAKMGYCWKVDNGKSIDFGKIDGLAILA